ncbi:MAG: KpsF/GutQ family sugar-phosphate isomerase, partial [Bdellovibrionales bacterium]|nr:KpsF/GutQ family sugar-phosphate isomerase [Bdellovibrionales bacterium]
SSFIAMKISSTFASIGVPSFFLHPAEAIHGDLGRLARTDVVIMLSNSGQAPEMLRIVPIIKRIGCKLVGITGNLKSELATHCDFVLNTGKVSEAGPLGLAPTTSSLVSLALGDALAMSVLERLEFTKERFAFFHPGGKLGASLLPISEVMRRGDQLCIVQQQQSVREVLHAITCTPGRPGAAAIVDQAGTLVGVFTDGNLRRCLEHGAEFLDRPVNEVMGHDPKVIEAGKLAPEALRILSELKIDQLIVTDSDQKPIGLLDIQDLVDIGLL